MTTTTFTTTAPAAVSRRPITLTIGALVLVLAALLALSSPFVPRGRGGFAGGGTRTAAGARIAGGGTTGSGGGTTGSGGGTTGSGGGAGTGTRTGNGAGGGAGNFTAARSGANAALFRNMGYIRIGEGLIGAFFTLLAAWGIWKRKQWGMGLALVASVVMLLTGAVTVILPLLGRTVTRALGSLALFTSVITSAQWVAIVGMILAVAVAVLVLLPASRKSYVTAPRERRIM